MFVFSKKSQELQENLKMFMNDYIYPNEEKITAEINSGNIWQPSEIIEDLKTKAKSLFTLSDNPELYKKFFLNLDVLLFSKVNKL